MKKILCIVSANPGHIDLGGNGFISVANKLFDNGHKVSWLSRGAQVERLLQRQQDASEEDTIPHLWMYGNILNAKHDKKILDTICNSLINFQKKLLSFKPDIILFDRVLTLGALVADQLNIPYVSMGSPGGYWSNEKGFLQPGAHPVKLYSDIAQSISYRLKWGHSSSDSFWIDSPYLNICFTGNSFYPQVSNTARKTAFVNNFSNDNTQSLKESIGISFGNTGSVDLMSHVLSCLHNEQCNISDNIDVYTGDRPGLLELLKNNANSKTHMHGWIDFSTQLHKHRLFIFMGGVGTIWHCINQNIPMYIIPTKMTDQLYNAHMVKQLGIGESLILDHPDATAVCNTIHNFDTSTPYHSAIQKFLSKDNFTDDVSTVCNKITNLAY